ncbi:glycosyltransferase family 4 protein [Shewanella scandinavica]|uniref:Glycosyltransferase family 4 protein n=1 Tax=Shewanella scandinavica TaxID=3063538 RepID=A0ABU3FUE8_9GAMM|nr:glycosyltransferase family 4 protein [Shewanella sp. SP2S1-2]MDT3278994.1 glycosyltransferase family 4 protein [Shewanella sp. SP2S1-2]
MKVFQVITRADTIGGAQKHVLDISTEILNHDCEVHVISSGDGPFRELIEKSNIPYHKLLNFKREPNLFADIGVLLQLRRLIKLHKPDVVALHSVKAGLVGRLSSIGLNCNVIYTAHGWSHIRSASRFNKKFYSFLEKILSFFSSRVICVSDEDYSFALNSIGISIKKLRLIPNGAIVPEFAELNGVRKTPECLNLLSVVRFQEPKDFDTLLNALRVIKDSCWHLSLLGDGENFELVKSQIVSYGLEKKISLEGFHAEISRYYKMADVVLLISKSEGLPMSLIEAMSYSKMLIGSNVGGIPELISHNWNGYLVGDGDFISLSTYISELSRDNNNTCKVFGNRSFERFIDKYTFDKMLLDTLCVYKGPAS